MRVAVLHPLRPVAGQPLDLFRRGPVTERPGDRRMAETVEPPDAGRPELPVLASHRLLCLDPASSEERLEAHRQA